MKRNRKQNIFGWLAASAALLLTTACAENADFEMTQYGNEGTRTVTFVVEPQVQEVSTRGMTRDDKPEFPDISDGKKADILIFAVYEVTKDDDEKETYTRLDGYSKDKSITINGKTFTCGDGQNVIDFTTRPVTIQLVTDPTKTYKVAFWAQSSKTEAYDSKVLEKVTVDYATATTEVINYNNDEYRDAFCAYANIPASAGNTAAAGTRADDETTNTQTVVTLRRPLAQVNVGTTGWDYEGAAILKPSAVGYTQSKIKLSGVAKYYNVVKGEAIANETADVTFAYNTIPAFINNDPETWDWTDPNKKYYEYGSVEGEVYLKVNLDNNKDIEGYVSWEDYKAYREWASLNKDEKEKTPYEGIMPDQTETFKYLSMCYVLVPEAGSTSMATDVNSGSVLTSVEFWAKGIDPTTGKDVGIKNGEDKVFKINNVPVQKNWRTNILGSSFFVVNREFKLYVVPDYCGDYNSIDAGETWQNGGVWPGENEDDDWYWEWAPGKDPTKNPDFPNIPDDDYYPKKGTQGGE